MKIAFLVVVDVPETGDFDVSPESVAVMAKRIEHRLGRDSKGEWTVKPHTLTPAQVAALP